MLRLKQGSKLKKLRNAALFEFPEVGGSEK